MTVLDHSVTRSSPARRNPPVTRREPAGHPPGTRRSPGGNPSVTGRERAGHPRRAGRDHSPRRSRTIGATLVPSSSMARRTSACGMVPVLTWSM